MSPSDILINICIIVFLLFINAFFVTAEFALVRVRKTRLEQLSNEGSYLAKSALRLVEETNKMLAAAQLGVTIASIALGWVAEATIVVLIEPIVNSVGASHAISTVISFILVTYFAITGSFSSSKSNKIFPF